MDSAIVAGAFTLGGVVVGWLGSWAQTTAASRRADARERDEHFGRAAHSADQLLLETGFTAYVVPASRERASEQIPTKLLSLIYELDAATVQLSIHGGRRLSDASLEMYRTTRELVLSAPADPARQQQRETAMLEALGLLRMARDLDRAGWWRLAYRKRRNAAYEEARKKLAALREKGEEPEAA